MKTKTKLNIFNQSSGWQHFRVRRKTKINQPCRQAQTSDRNWQHVKRRQTSKIVKRQNLRLTTYYHLVVPESRGQISQMADRGPSNKDETTPGAVFAAERD